LRKRRLLKPASIVVLVLLVGVAAAIEVVHRRDFGHFVPYGLHVDVVVYDANIGIPGQTKMYQVKLTNFTLLPVTLDSCSFLTDTLNSGTDYPYCVQRWDTNQVAWQTVAEPSREDFCANTLGRASSNIDSSTFWPGMSVDVMDGEATGARSTFSKGDSARFVVFRHIGERVDWGTAIASEPFQIQDQVIRDSENYRVAH
jgi:hypothetical protein